MPRHLPFTPLAGLATTPRGAGGGDAFFAEVGAGGGVAVGKTERVIVRIDDIGGFDI